MCSQRISSSSLALNVSRGPAGKIDLFFADDASRRNTWRPGMGPLIAIGGLWIPDASVALLEREIDRLCQTFVN
jgi:hypothetical protein